MSDREKITAILKAYTKKHNIMASSVILEEYAEELIRQGVVMPIKCKDCKHAYINSFSAQSGIAICKFWSNRSETNILAVQQDDFCSYGELKESEKV